MRFIVTFYNESTQRVKLLKTYEQAKAFIAFCRKHHPEYTDFKIKVIKY